MHRGVFKMNTLVTWKCTECGTTNKDDYLLTTLPTCEFCASMYFWVELISEKRLEKLNEVLDENSKG